MSRFFYILSGILTVILFSPYVRGIFVEEGMRWLYILLFSISFSFSLTPIMKWISHKLAILDIPDRRKIHTEPTPLLGGIAVYIGVVVPLLFNQIMDKETIAILSGGTVLLVMGIISDKRELSAKLRL